MWSRRSFLRLGGVVGVAAVGATSATGLDAIEAASAAAADRTPEDVAQDEFYWREIQEAFTLDRTLSNLNNGNSCPAPRVVLEACKRYMDMANMLPVEYNGMIGRNIPTIKRRLAAEFGCDVEELALTRNASESMQIAQDGLDLRAGDEVITTDQDYPRMLTTWDQRSRRDKIKVTRIQFPVPTTQDDLYQRFERAITPQTKVLHFCHITNLTGQLFPVQRLSRMARQRGITTMVDGAHALAHFPFKLRDLECDFYGVSRLVLMPSLCWESFPRLAAESLINGIPVLGSRRGGLPETLEHAGVLFEVPERYTPQTRLAPTAEEVTSWIDMIIRRWDDKDFYAQERQRCLAAAEAWHPDRLLPRFEEFLTQVIHSPGRRHSLAHM